MTLAPEGTYEGRAVAAAFATNSKGTDSIRVRFRLVEKFEGSFQYPMWSGYLTDLAVTRTIESLRAMGWKGANLAELQNLNDEECATLLPSVVSLKVEHRTFNDQQGKPITVLEVKFVNRSASGKELVGPKNTMDPSKLAGISMRLRGLCLEGASEQQPSAPIPGSDPRYNPAAPPIDEEGDTDYPF